MKSLMSLKGESQCEVKSALTEERILCAVKKGFPGEGTFGLDGKNAGVLLGRQSGDGLPRGGDIWLDGKNAGILLGRQSGDGVSGQRE